VSPRWESLAARARGLAAHLLADERLRDLDRARNLPELVDALHDTPYARFLGSRTQAPRDLELAVTRSVGDRMSTLGRWAGSGGGALAPIFLEQDAGNVRAIVRGVVGAVSHQRRLAGLLSTPTLDLRALETLAGAESVTALAAMLVAWAHPVGASLLVEAERAHAEPFRLEAALARGLAVVSLAAAGNGSEVMVRFVRESIDTDNILTALLLVGVRHEGEAGSFFVEGGRCLSRRDFVLAASARDRNRCADLLREATRGTLFAEPLAEPPASPSAVAGRILAAHVDDLAMRARRDPVSPLPVILFVLRLRMEMRRLRRVLWRLSLMERRRA
jgi:vacuolar-type H+-ATPase subunit C/Vma6